MLWSRPVFWLMLRTFVLHSRRCCSSSSLLGRPTTTFAPHGQVPPLRSFSWSQIQLRPRFIRKKPLEQQHRQSPASIDPSVFFGEQGYVGPVPTSYYIRPIVSAAVASAAIFVVAGAAYERRVMSFWDYVKHYKSRFRLPRWGRGEQKLTPEEYIQLKRDYIAERRRVFMEKVQSYAQWIPRDLMRAYVLVANKVMSLTDAEKTIWTLIGINTVVFGCWQSYRLFPFMSRWFLHSPVSGRSVTLLTSCFSHKDVPHFLFNMIGLYSFGLALHQEMGREQFVAMYLSAGIGASAFSQVLGLALRRVRPVLPSLGASGGLYGIVAACAYLNPNMAIGLIFFPFVAIPVR